jgi:hypothetical protein
MKLKLVVIDFELSSRTRKLLVRLGLPIAIVLGSGALAYANVPTVWKSGDLLKVADMNGNFSAVDKRLAALEDPYVGVTSIPVQGTLGGYAGAKALCVSQFNSPTAHMCMGEELVRSQALGKVIPQGWYSSGVAVSSAGVLINDCSGWASSDPTFSGATWSQNHPSGQGCNAANPVLCCD